MSSLKKNFKRITLTFFSKKKCCGTNNPGNNGSSLGMKNSSFFHAQTIIRRKKNRIHKLLLSNGIWSSDNSILQEEAKKFYKNLLCSNHPHQNCAYHEGNHPTLTEPDLNSLTHPVSKIEVAAALNSMKPFKALGLDGFQCIFFKQYWHSVGDDIFKLVHLAFETGHFDPAISDILIALIPKIESSNTYKRPINLCNITYKIITKVFIHRLKPILGTIISPYQSSIQPGRGTTDNAIVLQELFYFMCRSKKKGHVPFKIDLEKSIR